MLKVFTLLTACLLFEIATAAATKGSATAKTCAVQLGQSTSGELSEGLTRALNRAQSLTNDDVVHEYSEGVIQTSTYDRNGHKSFNSTRIQTVEVAVGELDASAISSTVEVKAVSKSNQSQATQNDPKLNVGAYVFSLVNIGEGYKRLEIGSKTTTTQYAVFEDEGLTQLASNKRGLFVYSNGREASQIIQIKTPTALPHSESLYVKSIDVSKAFGTDRYSPLLLGFDKFLILGGSHLGLLDTDTGIYVKLKLPEDFYSNRILSLQLQDERRTLKITRSVQDSYSRETKIVETTLDLAKLAGLK